MYELKTNTAIRIAVGPLVDPTDGKTAETALTVTALAVEVYQIKTDGSAVVRTAITPATSGSSNDMIHVTDDTTGMYDLELTAAQLNWLGNGRIAFYDVDGFLVHWIDIQVVSANYFDWKYGTSNVNADVIAISSDTTAAENLESYCDGTTPIPANITRVNGEAASESTAQLGVNVLSIVGATVNTATTQLGVNVVDWKGGTAPANTGDAYAVVNSGVYGNAQIKTAVDVIDDYIDTEVAAMLADTNELQTDLANGGRLDLLIDAIKAKTDSLPASPAAVGSAMTLTADYDAAKTAASQASVTAIDDYVDTEIAAIKAKTDLIPATPASVADIPTTTVIVDAVWNEAIADHLGAGSVGLALNSANAPTIGDIFDEQISAHLSVGSVGEAINSASAPTVGEVAAAVWDEQLALHTDVGSTGAAMAAAGGSGDPWSTALPGAYGDGTAGKIIGEYLNATVSVVDGVVDSILTVVNDLHNTDLPAVKSDTSAILVDTGTTLDAAIAVIDGIVDAIKVQTDMLSYTYLAPTYYVMVDLYRWKGSAAPANTGDAYAIVSNASYGNSQLKNLIDVIDNYIDTEVAAIKAKTDLIPATPAEVGSAMTLTAAYDAAKTAASQASVDAVDDYIDTEVAAIKAKTDLLPATPAGTSDIPTTDQIWSVAVPGAFAAGSAGRILGANLDLTVSSRLAKTDFDTAMADLKGTGFVKDTDSLVNVAHKAGTKGTDNIYDTAVALPTLTEMEASTVFATEATLTTITGLITKALGLLHCNYRVFPTYTGGVMTSATIKLYPTAADVATDTNATYEYTMTATYAGSEMTDFRQQEV